MSYFKNFPLVEYNFGDETNPDRFKNISIYAEVLDTIKGNVSFYELYNISDDMRPDQLSYTLYNTTAYAWTFFLMNDHIRERGWPMTNRELLSFAKKSYPYVTITTRDLLTDKFRIGQPVVGSTSGTTGTIAHRHLNLGQVAVSSTGEFVPGEIVTSTTIVDRPLKAINTVESITCASNGPEYLAAKYYTDTSGDILDIDPTIDPPAFSVEVTYYDDLVSKNNELRQIKILKQESINSVVRAFKQAVSS